MNQLRTILLKKHFTTALNSNVSHRLRFFSMSSNATASSNIAATSLFEEDKDRKGIAEITLVCNELGRNGDLRTVSGKFLKGELCSAHGLQPRDLRRLDGTLKNQLPAILVRTSAILINLGIIKAIIKTDMVILFESVDLTERFHQNNFLCELQDKIKKTSNLQNVVQQAFEFQIFEFILSKVCSQLQEEFDLLIPFIEDSLTDFEKYVHWDKLKSLLDCKKKVTHFKTKVNNIRDSIAEVLNSDSDMASMYLSSKDLPRPISAHEEVELLLESYLKIADEIASRVQELSLNMDSTEDILNIGLVSQRNELLLLELKLTIATFASSMGGFGAGLFGMNLSSSLEHTRGLFYYASGILGSISIVCFIFAWRKMKGLVRKQ